MTQPKSLINQVLDCCQERNYKALDSIFDSLNEPTLAGSLGSWVIGEKWTALCN